jgi:hypothetical protein
MRRTNIHSRPGVADSRPEPELLGQAAISELRWPLHRIHRAWPRAGIAPRRALPPVAANARALIHPTGRVSVHVGTVDHGREHATSYAAPDLEGDDDNGHDRRT